MRCRGVMLSINCYLAIQMTWGKVEGGRQERELEIAAVSKALIIF